MNIINQLKLDLKEELGGDIEIILIKNIKEVKVGEADNTYIQRAKARKKLITLRDLVENSIIDINDTLDELDKSNVDYNRTDIGTTKFLDQIQDIVSELQNPTKHAISTMEGKALAGIKRGGKDEFVEFSYRKIGDNYENIKVLGIVSI